MLKTKLPVIVLRNMILLPHGELKLEISNDVDKAIIEKASINHDNYVLLISPECITEETLNKEDLPSIGCIGKITSNFELPNNNIRITIIGVNRAHIYEYIENINNVDAIIGPVNIKENDKAKEEAILRKLKKEIVSYITIMPNISNGLIPKINEEDNLEKLTDFIVNILPLKFDTKVKYMYEISSIERANLLIKNITLEKNISLIDRDIENTLREELDKQNKDYILREKIKVIREELGDDVSKEQEIEELKFKIDELNAPNNIKEKLFKEVKKYEMIPPTSPEVSMVKNYIDTLMSLPFGIYTNDNKNISKIKKELDKSHYGLDEVKDIITEYIAVKQLTNSNESPIICLVGPPGVGKTTLAYSISKALNRNFVKMSVGGVSDEAEIIGHRRTYMASNPGRIINGIIKSKSSNPVFLIDEVDKMTKDIKGDPSSALLEVLDKTQNKTFYDNYIEEPFDLSNVMFILTANDINGIPYALRDRLEIINLSSYTIFEKMLIVKNHIYDKLLKINGLNKNIISIDDETIKYIIENYTKEAGVRELERILSKIMRKVAKDVIEKNKKSKHVITKDNLYEYLGKEKYNHIDKNKEKEKGIVNGLAYTDFGGEILPIETTIYNGKEDIVLTGSLGDVMIESAKVALGYIKSHSNELNVDLSKLEGKTIHINAVNTAIPKNGPSAGITLTTSMLSLLLNKKVNNDIAMTGEITLNGKVLPIGGLREKSIAAYNNKIKTIYIPKENEVDLDEIPKEVKDNLKIVFINSYSELFNKLFK